MTAPDKSQHQPDFTLAEQGPSTDASSEKTKVELLFVLPEMMESG